MTLALVGVRQGGGLRQLADENLAEAGATYTFGNGLTLTGSDVANDLITGKAGGQSIIGGTAASENLKLRSTSHATRGRIQFGNNASTIYDEVNDRFGFGTAADALTEKVTIKTGCLAFTGAFTLPTSDFVDALCGGGGTMAVRLQGVYRFLINAAGIAGSAADGQFLYLQSTTSNTKGQICFGAATLTRYHETSDRWGFGTLGDALNDRVTIKDGALAFTGANAYYFKLPADATGNATAATGRVPISVGGATKYLRYFND